MNLASTLLLIVSIQQPQWACAQELRRFTYSEPVMGTEFRVVLYAPSERHAKTAADAAFDRAYAIDSLLSDWRSDSEVNRLSRLAGTDRCIPVSHDLIEVLGHAQIMAAASNGSFDVTVGPLTRLWRWAMRRAELPPESRLSAARSAVGYEKLILEPTERCVRLTVPEMKLDLGAIAKGFAADEMLKILGARGAPRALVDAGGDIVVGESPPGRDGWLVETRVLDPQGHFVSRDEVLANAAVAVSGDRHRFLQAEGVRYSHLLDPRTGFGLTERRLVTIIAPSGIEADALASAISVMGRSGIFLADKPGFGARIIEFGSTHKEAVEVGRLSD